MNNRMFHRRTFGDLAILMLGTVMAQGLTLILTPWLARLYSPADFGKLALFLAISGIATTCLTLRYEMAVLLPKERSDAIHLIFLCFALTLVGGGILGLLIILLSGHLKDLLQLSKLGGWLIPMLFVAIAGAILSVIQTFFNREKLYWKMAGLRFFQSLISAASAVFLGLFCLTNDGLLFAQTLAVISSAVVALWLARSALCALDKQAILNVAKVHQDVPRYLLPTAVLDIVTMQLPIILISSFFSPQLVGQFSMAWRLLMLPMAVVGSAISPVFMQKFSLVCHNAILGRKLLVKFWLLLLLIGIFPLLTVFFGGEWIFETFLGSDWGMGGRIAAIMAPMVMAMFISSPTSASFVFLGIQKIGLYFGIAVFLYRPLCLYVGYINNDFLLGLRLWVMCELAQIFLYQCVVWKVLEKQ